MFNKTFCESFCELKLLYLKGYKKYPKNDWMDRGVDHHFEHVTTHLKKAKQTHDRIKEKDSLHTRSRLNTVIIGNLIHAALRILMIAQIKILS
jgi:hypothetical protein